MDLRKAFGTNKKKEQEGVWVKGEEGSEFLIARAGNPAAEKLTQELMRPHRRRLRAGTLPDEVTKEISYTVLATAVLLGWKGVKVDGKEVPYSPEQAKELFTEMPDFADFVAGYSMEAALFQDREEKARLGN